MDWTEIQERVSGDVTILDLRGQATVSEGRGPLFRRIITLLQAGQKKILLNLLNLPYLDSQGLGDIVQGYKVAAANGGSVRLCEVHDRIKQLLEMTRIVAVVEAYDSEQQALDAFRDARQPS